MVYKWSPNIYYHKYSSGFSPGFIIDKYYGEYEKTILKANYAFKSKELFWYLSGKRQSVHHFPRTTFYFWGFNLPGVKEYGFELEKKWNKVYGRTPTHTLKTGLYSQPKYDSLRAEPLGYDPNGNLAVGYFSWGVRRGIIDFNLNYALSIGSFSTWDFNRLTLLVKLKKEKNLVLYYYI